MGESVGFPGPATSPLCAPGACLTRGASVSSSGQMTALSTSSYGPSVLSSSVEIESTGAKPTCLEYEPGLPVVYGAAPPPPRPDSGAPRVHGAAVAPTRWGPGRGWQCPRVRLCPLEAFHVICVWPGPCSLSEPCGKCARSATAAGRLLRRVVRLPARLSDVCLSVLSVSCLVCVSRWFLRVL